MRVQAQQVGERRPGGAPAQRQACAPGQGCVQARTKPAAVVCSPPPPPPPRRPLPTWPSVLTATRRLVWLPPSWMASMTRGRISGTSARSWVPATVASSPMVISTATSKPSSAAPGGWGGVGWGGGATAAAAHTPYHSPARGAAAPGCQPPPATRRPHLGMRSWCWAWLEWWRALPPRCCPRHAAC